MLSSFSVVHSRMNSMTLVVYFLQMLNQPKFYLLLFVFMSSELNITCVYIAIKRRENP